MRIRVIGENDCARALRGLLRQAGFAVTALEAAFPALPVGGYTVEILEASDDDARIHFDSTDCPLEAAILRHVTRLSSHPVVVDRPGGRVHSDRAIALRVPSHDAAQQNAAEHGVLRGLMDATSAPRRRWWQRRR